jgi:hypothetical protein
MNLQFFDRFGGNIRGNMVKDFYFSTVQNLSRINKNLVGQNPEKPCVAGSMEFIPIKSGALSTKMACYTPFLFGRNWKCMAGNVRGNVTL